MAENYDLPMENPWLIGYPPLYIGGTNIKVMHRTEQIITLSTHKWRDIAKGVFMEMRILPVLVWAFTAIVVGTALAHLETGIFHWWNFTLAIFIACLVQAYPTHAANEIVDWLSGTDAQGFGGSKVVREGLLTVRDLKIILVVSMGAVIALALLAIFTIEVRLLWFGCVGIAACLFYSLPPFKLGYHPFVGEWFSAFVGVFVAVTGGYYIQVLTVSPAAVLAGIALGISDIAVMEMFHTIDYEADRAAVPPKRTTIVFLGPERGKTYVMAHAGGAAVLFWALTFVHWQAFVWASAATVSVFFYWNYSPRDPRSIIHNTKKATWATIVGGLAFASLVNLRFALLVIPVILGYTAYRKWGKLPKPNRAK